MLSRQVMMSAAGLLYSLAWCAAGSAADAAKSSDWSRGLRLYKQGKFAAACPLLAQAAAAAPANGAIWADLGLCELKLGDKPASIHASLLAARFGNERVRKNAYFNLYLAGYSLDLSAECGALAEAPAELACTTPVFACTNDWQAYGTAAGTNGTVALFASSLEDARAAREDVALSAGPRGPGEVPLSEAHVCFNSWCQLHAWRCDASTLVQRRADACFQKALGPPPKDLCLRPSPACETFQRCETEACAAADAAIAGSPGAKSWPAVVREHEQREAECMKDCFEGDTLSCSVVVVDPCQDRIGYVCTETDLENNRERVTAGEIAFSG